MTRFWKPACFSLLSLVLCAPIAVGQESHSWTYSGKTGPSHWSEVSRICKYGHAQSPIDIKQPQLKELPLLEFDYRPAALNVIDNGHTVQVNYVPGSTLKVGNKTYELVQFHFHHLSETAIRGKHSQTSHPRSRERMGRNSRRTSAGAWGFISSMSRWLGPPNRYSKMTFRARPNPRCSRGAPWAGA